MTVTDPLAARIRPADCAVVEQTPPDFGWPSSGGSYQLTLTYPDGSKKSISTNRNWVNWSDVLSPGAYTWQVTSNGTSSRPRKFTVPTGATQFVVPAASTVLSQLSAKTHPRGLPDSATLATMKNQRSSAVSALMSEVKSRNKEALPGPEGGNAAAYSEAALRAAAAAVYSGQRPYYNEAIRRLTNLASWDARGATSYANDAVGSRAVSLALAIGYDWLYPMLSSNERNQVLAALKLRVGDMYADLASSIESRPRNAEGNRSLVITAVIATLVTPDLPEGATWVNEMLPLAANVVSPWAGDEGGFANGQTEGFIDLGAQLLPWYVLRWSTGIDIAKKGWVKNWARYMAYFAPTGTPALLFGDGLETVPTESRASFAKGYTNFSPTPLGNWYASKLTGEDPTRLEYLMAPPAESAGNAFPTDASRTLLLPTIGQIAMHTDLANPARTSVYFKSSPPPYGAFDHSHADQNSFVVNSGGQRLAIEAGYYDGYKSPHWTDWYHQTRAKNAITYDGGKGQVFYEQGGKAGYGGLTRHVSGADYEIVTGDATAAYGGALTKAERSLVYLRPNLILVYDNLASDVGRQWEWNIHALNTMSVVSDSKVSIENNGQRLCVEMLDGPARRFEQTDRFTTQPSGNHPSQWHGKFYSTELLPAAEFVVLLNVDCTTATASASKTDGIWTVKVNDKIVQIGNGTLTVNADDGSAGNSGAPAADTAAPSVPSGLTATAASSSQINLQWNPSTDNVAVTGYYVYLNDKALTTVTGTSFSHTGLTAGTTYNYRVSAYDAVPNHSAWTASVAATTSAGSVLDTTAPSVPTGLAAAAVSSSQINLKWNPSTDNVAVTGYYVYLNDKALGTTTTTSFSHTGLTAGTTYNYRVSAYDAVPNHSAWTDSVPQITSGESNGGGASGCTQGNTGGLPVIPCASGFGINTPAGRGGTVYRVTNLNESGTGSLRACIDATGPRVCIFEISGTINTTSDIAIKNPYITIAGQTAPSPGILIRGAGISVLTHDVLLQHLRVRPGDASTGPSPDNRDAFKIDGYRGNVYNVVLDHMSGSWSTDELISTWGSSNGNVYDVTIRNSIFSEALDNSIHPKGPHSAGLLVGYRSSRITIANNLFAYIGWRNPRIANDSTDVMLVNNMLYRTRGSTTDQIDFGTRGSGNIPMRASVQGNHFVLAPGLKPINTIDIRSDTATSFKIFLKDNSGPWMTSDPWSVVSTSRDISTLNASTPPIWAPGAVAMPYSSVEAYVLGYSGARPLDRDAVDRRVVSQVQSRTGGIIDSPSQVGGYPFLAVNVRPLTLPANPNGVTASGYTNLELWLHQMAKAVEGL